MNILNKLEISKNSCANYVSRNQMCKPKPQVARKRRQMAQKMKVNNKKNLENSLEKSSKQQNYLNFTIRFFQCSFLISFYFSFLFSFLCFLPKTSPTTNSLTCLPPIFRLPLAFSFHASLYRLPALAHIIIFSISFQPSPSPATLLLHCFNHHHGLVTFLPHVPCRLASQETVSHSSK